MSLLYAGVCLLDNPYSIDGMYDYLIPPELSGEVAPGSFVTVPFGTANRRKIALVREVRTDSRYPEAKMILSICPDNLSLDGEMLGLCDFMKQYTLCTTGDAVRAMIPSSALGRVVTKYELSGEVQKEDAILQKFLQEPIQNGDGLIREFGLSAEAKLRRFCKEGILKKTYCLEEKHAEKSELLYYPAIEKDKIEAVLAGEKIDAGRALTEPQKAVLSLFLKDAEPMTALAVKSEAAVTDAPIQSLLKRGLLLSHERRVDRNPYADVTFTGQTLIKLNEEQNAALKTLSELAFSGEAKAALLYGVTGSGKTSVMAALMDKLLAAGKGVILLLPEISLTPQSVAIFCSRYGERVAVIHSALSQGERYDAYCRIREGKADVVIGTRSAVFAPVKNLGAVIIDEEQEHTYKSDQDPKYHTRDIARYRCAKNKGLMLLASATPSLESYKKAKDGVYSLVKLSHRFGNATLPSVEIADMREESKGGNLSPLGENLLRRLAVTQGKKEQAILFLNRRGYNHFISCRKCGQAVVCPNCSVSMTYHTKRGGYLDGELVCHWCGKKMPLPKVCPSCGSEHLARMGFGTQRVEEELNKLFPESKVLRMDTDTVGSKFAYDEMLSKFRSHGADILLGTQMVTKGHDFSDVTLVGVLLADMSLYLDDFRAAERTFAMLTQVIGRAGRAEKAGLAVIQTNNPDSEVITLACRQDYEAFFEREIRLRKALTFPPFCDIALVTFSGVRENELLRASTAFAAKLKAFSEGEYKELPLMVFGPFEAPVYRVDNRYRMRMVIKCKLNRQTLSMFEKLSCNFASDFGKYVNLSIDFNPSNL